MDTMKRALQSLFNHQDLSHEQMTEIMRCIMTGDATEAQIGAFLAALRMKGETVTEITAAAEVMRALATPVKVDSSEVIDIVGTGGDGLNTFNISTATSLVVAAAGAKVAKHGNRSVSSSSGSADLLEMAGVNLELSPEQVGTCIQQVGIGFMFAPAHHSAMKYAITPRKEMGVRTIFNVLGPLTNPAGAKKQLLGVFSPDLVYPLAEVLRNLGSERVMVVCADDGMDEISLAAPTQVAELKDGKIESYTITPEDMGIQTQSLDSLLVDDASQSLETVCGVLQDRENAARDIVVLNSAAALYVAGLAEDLPTAAKLAAMTIQSGDASNKLSELVHFTQVI